MSYISQKMALSGSAPGDYRWEGGKCYDLSTGKAHPGNQRTSQCYAHQGPAPSRWDQVLNFTKEQADRLGNRAIDKITAAGERYIDGGDRGGPSSSFTTSGMLMPAVVVVGGLVLILALRK